MTSTLAIMKGILSFVFLFIAFAHMTGAAAVDKRSTGDFLSLIFAYLVNDIIRPT